MDNNNIKTKSSKSKIKKVLNKPNVKPYCPPFMVRYDGGKAGHDTMWVCKMCMTGCVCNITAASHSISCRDHFKKLQEKIISE